jgi:hypothetical protein
MISAQVLFLVGSLWGSSCSGTPPPTCVVVSPTHATAVARGNAGATRRVCRRAEGLV